MKRHLRDLKRLERTLRGSDATEDDSAVLVWDEFFSTKDAARVRYPFGVMLALDRDSRKRAIDEYLEAILSERLESPSPTTTGRGGHTRELLERLGLSPQATRQQVAERFRQLAHEFHPDHGGDDQLMAELLEVYRALR